MNQLKYCFQKNNIWYFKKRIPAHLNKSNLVFKISFKKLLGRRWYHIFLLNSSIFSISNFINSNIELFFTEREKVTLKDLSNYVIDLIQKYMSQALNRENDYVGEIGTRRKEIERQRFDTLRFFDQNGISQGGYTEKALLNEIDSINKACDLDTIGSFRTKAKEILNRQDILSKEEIANIPEELLSDFEEALVKQEREIIKCDLSNFRKQREDNNEELLPEEIMNIVREMKRQNSKQDRWEFLISDFIKKGESEGLKRLDTAKSYLIEFQTIMEGDDRFELYPKRNILSMNINDILRLKQIYRELPIFTYKATVESLKKNGLIYTIELAKKDKNSIYAKKDDLEEDGIFTTEFGISVVGGINVRLKEIRKFIKQIKILDSEKYGNINIDLWSNLTVNHKSLSNEDKRYNDLHGKPALKSEDLNEFLYQLYPSTSQGIKNFKVHSGKSYHILWGMLIGIFTGSRAEEISQLKVSDIEKETVDNEEIYSIHFHITDYNKQNIKSLAGTRRVPISNHLIELGFLNFLQERIKSKEVWLFEHLKIGQHGKRDKFTTSYITSFQKFYRVKYPNKIGKLPDFHSLRDFFISLVIDNLNSENEIRQYVFMQKIIGHETEKSKEVTLANYNKKNYDSKLAKEQINNLHFDISDGFESLKRLISNKYENNILTTLDIETI